MYFLINFNVNVLCTKYRFHKYFASHFNVRFGKVCVKWYIFSSISEPISKSRLRAALSEIYRKDKSRLFFFVFNTTIVINHSSLQCCTCGQRGKKQFSNLSFIIYLYHKHYFFFFQENDSVNVVILDLVFYGVISVLSIIGLFITDNYVKHKPKLLTVVSSVAFVALFVANFYVPVHHSILNSQQNLRPTYTTHLILACYIFFNVTRTSVAFVLGLFTTIIHIVAIIIITYKQSDVILRRVSHLFILFINFKHILLFCRQLPILFILFV